jgi:hypothetical protein
MSISTGVSKTGLHRLQAMAGFARDINMPLGIIYNAGRPPASMSNQA